MTEGDWYVASLTGASEEGYPNFYHDIGARWWWANSNYEHAKASANTRYHFYITFENDAATTNAQIKFCVFDYVEDVYINGELMWPGPVPHNGPQYVLSMSPILANPCLLSYWRGSIPAGRFTISITAHYSARTVLGDGYSAGAGLLVAGFKDCSCLMGRCTGCTTLVGGQPIYVRPAATNVHTINITGKDSITSIQY